MAAKNPAGWLLIVAALAVPSGAFIWWYGNLNAEKKAELTRKVRLRNPEGVFQTAPGSEKLNNPIAAQPASTATAAAAVPAASTGAAVAMAQPQPGAAAAQPPAPAAAQPAPAQPAAAPAPAPVDPSKNGGASSPNGGASSPSGANPGAPAEDPNAIIHTGPIAQVVLARDPLLSPYDVVRIAEAEAAKQRALDELEAEKNRKRGRTRRVEQERPAESLVDLQGIVTTGEGEKAIVNGEMVGEGDMVGAIKVVSITPDYVVFLHKGKRFKKGVSK